MNTIKRIKANSVKYVLPVNKLLLSFFCHKSNCWFYISLLFDNYGVFFYNYMHSQVCITRHMLFNVAAKIMWLWVINVKVLTLNGSNQQGAVECSPACICSLFTRSQMMSKCGKNKKVAHDLLVKWVTDALTNKGKKKLTLWH